MKEIVFASIAIMASAVLFGCANGGSWNETVPQDKPGKEEEKEPVKFIGENAPGSVLKTLDIVYIDGTSRDQLPVPMFPWQTP